VVFYDIPYYESDGSSYLQFGYSGYFNQMVELAKEFDELIIYAPCIATPIVIEPSEKIIHEYIHFRPLRKGIHVSKKDFFLSFFLYKKRIKEIIDTHKDDAIFLAYVPGSFVGILAAYILKKMSVRYFLRVTAYLGGEFRVRNTIFLKNILVSIVQPFLDRGMMWLLRGALVFYSGKVLYGAYPGHYSVISASFNKDIIVRRMDACTHPQVHILYVGVLDERKGIIYLIEAVKKMRDTSIDARLTIVGGGWGKSSEENVRTLVNQYALNDFVHFAGWIPFGDALFESYKKADIFIFPTLYDIQGKVTLEAMAFGVPVIASDVGGVSSVVIHEHNGLLVQPKSPEAIYDAALRYIKDDTLRLTCIQNGYIMAEACTIETQVDFMFKKIQDCFTVDSDL
jgi:glycosyltransferase involved in cell wall biosynthesis